MGLNDTLDAIDAFIEIKLRHMMKGWNDMVDA